MAQPSALPVPAQVPVIPDPVIPVPAIPLRDVAPWAALVVLLSLTLLYFVGAEEGATALSPSGYVHEFLHDGRHLLGFPCH